MSFVPGICQKYASGQVLNIKMLRSLRIMLALFVCLLFGLQGAVLAQAPDQVQAQTPAQAPPLAPAIAGDAGSSSTGDPAADANSAAFKTLGPDLNALEFRFFAHTFPNETTEQRLDRIERLVYGAKRKGPPQVRVSRLLLDVPDLTNPSSSPQVASQPQGATPVQGSNPAQGSAPNQYAAPSEAAAPTQYGSPSENAPANQVATQPAGGYGEQYSQPAAPESSQNNEDYPTVDALEQEILGSKSPNLPLAQRLSNMEQKAFGQTSPSLSLSARVDQLKQYVAKQHPQNEDYLSSPYPTFQADSASLVSEVAAMEQEVFGKTFAKDTLISRVNRLNEAVFRGQTAQTFTPLSIQVGKLLTALQPKFSASTEAQPQSGYANYSTKQGDYSKYKASKAENDDDKTKKKGHFFHDLGKVLGGAAVIAGRAVGSMAVGSMMGGYGMGGYGMGYPGYYGGGYGGYGPPGFMY